MAKNRTMRVAVLMLALTLITTCFVGGTFAKYTTGLTIGGSGAAGGDADGNDGSSARVAKFGVVIEANAAGDGTGDGSADSAISLFKTEYKNGSDQVIVKSDDYVVAPGTGNGSGANGEVAADGDSLFGLTITGTPEVAVNVKYDATISLGSGVSVDTDGTGATNGKWVITNDQGVEEYYCPLIFTINGKDYVGNDYDSLFEFEKALTEAIEFDKDFAPGTVLEEALETAGSNGGDMSKFDIAWRWPFEGETGSEQTDEKDTALADAAAAASTTDGSGNVTVDSAFSFDFEIAASVTQINTIA